MLKIILLVLFLTVCSALNDLPSANRTGTEVEEDVEFHTDEADSQSFNFPHPKIPNVLNETRNKFFRALYNLSGYLPFSVEYAVTVGRNCNIVENNPHYYGVPGLVISAIIFVIGVLFCFIGYRLLKINLFLIGFVIGGLLAYFVLLAFVGDFSVTWRIYAISIASVIVGIILGLLTIGIYYVGMFLAGGSVGFLATWFLLSVIDINFFQTHVYVPLLIAIGVGVVCGIITLIFQKWLVILGTSVIGAFLIIWSLDYYLELGQMIYFLFLFAVHRSMLEPCWFSWVIVVVFVILMVVGIIFQACVTGRKYDHKKDFEDGICCGLCKKCRKRRREREYVPLKSMD